MSFAWLWDPRLSASLGWALAHSLWQGCLIAVLLAGLLRLIRRPQVRHGLSGLALLLCLILPTCTGFREFQRQRSASFNASILARSEHVRNLQPSFRQAPTRLKRLEAWVRPHLPRMAQVWVLGCMLLSLRLGMGWGLTLRWKRLSKPAPAEWEARFQKHLRHLGLSRSLTLKVLDQLQTPLVVGAWRPMILVPTSLFTGLPPEYLEALLLHELAHIHRHDPLLNLVQTWIEVLLFYHPAIWWISRRIRIEREVLADEQAAWALGEPRRLALALNALEELQPEPSTSWATPSVAARGGHLVHRIRHLLQLKPTQPAARTWLVPSLLALGLLTPLAAAIQLRNGDPTIFISQDRAHQLDILAQAEGIDPQLLRSIAWVESHCNPEARSSNGAMGLLQVMPETALKFGATNLQDPDQVARAGAHFLRHLLDTYNGDLTKAVSAYNGGEAAVNSGVLSDETRAYTPMVLALYKTQAVQAEVTHNSKPTVKGALRLNQEGNLELNAHISCMGGALLEVFPYGSSQALSAFLSGNTDRPANSALSECTPRMTFPVHKQPLLRIRVTDHAGEGAWGEAIVDARTLPTTFQLAIDHAAMK